MTARISSPGTSDTHEFCNVRLATVTTSWWNAHGAMGEEGIKVIHRVGSRSYEMRRRLEGPWGIQQIVYHARSSVAGDTNRYGFRFKWGGLRYCTSGSHGSSRGNSSIERLWIRDLCRREIGFRIAPPEYLDDV